MRLERYLIRSPSEIRLDLTGSRAVREALLHWEEVSQLGKFKENWYIVLVVLIFIFMFGYGVYNNIRQRPSAPVSEEMTTEEVPTQESSPAGMAEEKEEATPSAESSPSGEEEVEASPAAHEELTPPELMDR